MQKNLEKRTRSFHHTWEEPGRMAAQKAINELGGGERMRIFEKKIATPVKSKLPNQ